MGGAVEVATAEVDAVVAEAVVVAEEEDEYGY